MAGLSAMERIWIFDAVAVAVARVDFLDPAIANLDDARERGVRVEIRPAEAVATGSIYASTDVSLAPARCRIDLLESRPHAADRMHWHPAMTAGEPESRVFDAALSADPLGWVGDRLRDVESLLGADDTPDRRIRSDAPAIAAAADEIVAAIEAGLAWARAPWPAVERNDRGMARV
jgi:hypothetical protein